MTDTKEAVERAKIILNYNCDDHRDPESFRTGDFVDLGEL